MRKFLSLIISLSLCPWADAALGQDGSVHKNVTTGSSTTLTLTTSNANDIIVMVATINDSATGPSVSSITSSNTTGWARRTSANVTAIPQESIDIWYGTAANALSSEVITVNWSGTVTFVTIDIFGISGADTTTKSDSNASCPVSNSTLNTDSTISTSNANDFIIGAYRFSGTANPTQGSGWTKISGANFQLAEYKIVSATQSSLDITIGTGNADNNGGVADAIIQAGGASSGFNKFMRLERLNE